MVLKKISRILIGLAISLGLATILKGAGRPEFFLHSTWTEENGLPGNTIHSICQTHDGYIWLALEIGLVRFDGIKFDFYGRENIPGLKTTFLDKLLVDSQGTLWACTNGSGIILYRDHRFKLLTIHDGLLSDSVMAMMQASDGTIWIGTHRGLNRFERGRLASIPLPESLNNKDIRSLLEDRLGQIWVGTYGGGLVRLRRNQNRFEAEHMGFAGVAVITLYQDREQTIWIGTMESGLIGLQGNRRLIFNQDNQLNCNYICSIYEDPLNNLWVGTYGGGINILDPGRKKMTIMDSESGLTSDLIRSIFEDREKTIWIGTASGLTSLRDIRIRTYTKKNGLPNDFVTSLFEDSKNQLWIGTGGFGASCFDGTRFQNFTRKQGLANNSIYAIAEGIDGSIWLSSLGGGLNRYKDGRIKVYQTEAGLADLTVRGLIRGRDGRIWAGTTKGFLYCLEGERFVLKNKLDYRINSLFQDSQGSLWICTWGDGLGCRQQNGIHRYDTSSGLSSNAVMCMFEDETGSLWIGTPDNGLNRFSHGSFRYINRKSGLPDDYIYSILEDQRHYLWLSTNRGIVSVKREELEKYLDGKSKVISFLQFGREDGMRSIEGNGGSQSAGCRTHDGKLWFTTIRGLSMVDPDNISVNSQAPPVVIEKVMIQDAEFLLKDVIEVAPGNHTIKIQYTALSFILPQKIRFKYQLEGVDQSWIEAGTRRIAEYHVTAPGKYRFRVIACNSDAIWNMTGAEISFNFQPYFYQKTSFILLMLGLLAIILSLTFFILKKFFILQKIRQKYARFPLKPGEAEAHLQKIIHLVEKEKLYLNPDLTIKMISSRLLLSPRVISQVINEKLKCRFTQLINGYRIKVAQEMMNDPQEAEKSILDISLQVGFNSKSSFNKAFKEITGQIPSEYKKENRYKRNNS